MVHLGKKSSGVAEEIENITENVIEEQREPVEGAVPSLDNSEPMKERTPQQKNAKWIIFGVIGLMACTSFSYGIGKTAAISEAMIEEQLGLDAEYQKLLMEFDASRNFLSATNAHIEKNIAYYEKAVVYYEKEAENEAKLEALKAEVAASEAKLEGLTRDITKASGKPVRLPAGEFKVGEDILGGRYNITGSSNLFVYDSAGRLKVNIILGGGYGVPSYVCSLSTGDTVICGGSDTFTPIN